jgi:hypothetical protein
MLFVSDRLLFCSDTLISLSVGNTGGIFTRPVDADPTTRTPAGEFNVSVTSGSGASISAELLGESNENALGSAHVAEPVHVLVPDHLVADEFRAVLAQAAEDLIDVVCCSPAATTPPPP